VRIIWTLGPITVLELTMFESTSGEAEEPAAPTVVDMSIGHDRGFGFEPARWQNPPLNSEPYWDNPFGDITETRP
jgi:hypothetical protein